MARAWCAMSLSLLAACADNPYLIGHARDAVDAGSEACPADALICAGFEDADWRASWTDIVIENAGQIDRSSERAHSGPSSLHAQSRGPETVAVAMLRFPAVRSGSLYLRAYVYVPSGVPTQTMNLFFIGSRPDPAGADPFIGLDINLEGEVLQVYSPQSDPRRQTGTQTIPRDRWFCLRADVEISRSAEVALYVDDALALRAGGVDSLPSEEGVTMLRAGVDWSSDQAEHFEVFMDDLVFATRPVDCS
jgi:hypothetical protein